MKIRPVAVILFLGLFAGSNALALSWFTKSKVVFEKGDGTWVKISRANKKLTPFEHPHRFSVEQMQAALRSVRYFKPGLFSVTGKQGKEYDLFTDEEVKMMAPPLAEAFAAAEPGQWVDFSIKTFRGPIILGSFRQSDGVMFVKDGRLNMALRNIALKTAPDQQVNTYDPTRGYRSMTRLVAGKGEQLKEKNWLAMEVKNIADLEPPLKSGETLPATSAQPAPDTTAPAHPAAPKASAEQRLRELQEIYDQGLITKQEYEKKRKQIIDEL